jgi:hypothetical protein
MKAKQLSQILNDVAHAKAILENLSAQTMGADYPKYLYSELNILFHDLDQAYLRLSETTVDFIEENE